MEPNRTNIRLWVDALRSGKFTQGRGVLYDRNLGRYCCLGVANVVAFEAGDVEACSWQYPTFDHRYTTGVLNVEMLQWLGIYDENPRLAEIPAEGDCGIENCDYCGPPSTTVWLAASVLNDDKGWPFDRIADAIEAKYLTDDKVPASAG